MNDDNMPESLWRIPRPARPPWWQTIGTWALVVVALVVVGLIFGWASPSGY